jgi:probable phosphoglycerate mutase
VCARVWTALDQLLAEHPGRRIIIAGHVGTIRALTVRALGAPLSAMNRMELAPASLTTLTWYADGNASMRSFAESSHLDGVGSAWTP